MTGRRDDGTSPRQQGTSPRQQGTNPRAVTVKDFERLERKVDELLRRLPAHDAPTAVVVDGDGVFLPGTGRLGGTHERPLSPDAVAALEALDREDP